MKNNRTSCLSAAMAFFASLSTGQAALTWSQSFNGTGADAPLSTYSWVNYSGAGGVLTPNGTTSGTVPVFSNANGASGTPGYLYDGAAYANRNLWFTETSPDFAVSDLTNISFALRSYYDPALGDNTVGFAVRLDGAWYRTATTYMSTDNTWQTFNLTNIPAVTWLKVDFTAGTTLNGLANNGLNPSGAAALPTTGTIDAIGFYGFQSNPIRFDEISITYVPEPSSALLGLAALPLLGLRRRK